jgi:flagellar hook protein FlgE
MSLYGAMFSGVSGLNAQSQALGVISDNISNVNTTGYKATASRFATMVTQQSLDNSYAPGGVLFNRQSLVDHQGLLQSTGSATDIGIAGNGMFVVQGTTNPASTDPFFYTRAGSFTPDQSGFLRNTAGYYLMGWATDATGTPIVTNTSALTSLEAVNISGVAGNATATDSISLGANLPATANVGDDFVTNVQIYDSLGVTHDLGFTWTKGALNQWNLSVQAPEGSGMLVLDDAAGVPYAASARLDFDSQPVDGETVTIGGTTYEFNSTGGVSGGNTAVTIGADIGTTVASLATAVADPRVTASNDSIIINQSPTGAALVVNPSGTAGIAQNATGGFTLPALTSWPALPTGQLTFSGQPADGDTIVINGTTYEFESAGGVGAGNTSVTIGGSLAATLTNLDTAVADPRVSVTGTTVDFTQTTAGSAISVDAAGLTVTPIAPFTVAAYTGLPAVTFNGNGTPSGFNVSSLTVSGWESGAADSTIAVDLGTAGLSDGLTQSSGAYSIGFINQNGVQFGSFSGVAISDEGLVVALFDNGETLPIYKIPLATFANPNGLTAKTGNIYLASDTTGTPILRDAKSSGAGTIAAGALENSTVDLGTEFTNMIIAQRAYSAATKIITTADDMLDELVRIKR